jgi:hypothetical protein
MTKEKSDPLMNFAASRSTAIATLLRLALFFFPLDTPVLPNNWLYSPALVSLFVRPHQTLNHLREAISIQGLLSGKFVNAYQANQAIRVPPLVLAGFTPLVTLEHSELWWSLLLLMVDFGIAYLIEALGREILLKPNSETDTEEEVQSQLPEAIRAPNAHIFPITQTPATPTDEKAVTSPLIPMTALPSLAAQVYYWSPITALSGGIYLCFQNIACLFLVASLYLSCRVSPQPGGSSSSSSLTAFSLALASYLEPHYVVFLVPIWIWKSRQQQQESSLGSSSPWLVVALFVLWSACLQGLSFTLVGPANYWNVLQATYGMGWKQLTPNLSVLWYLHMQLFGRFRDYYGIMLVGLPYLLVVPLTVRLYKYPMVLVTIFWLIWTIFRPTETLHDLNVALSLLLLSPRSLARMEVIACVALCSIWVPVILYVLDCWMWLEPGGGNANYIFFQCLAYNAFLGIILGQFCSASLQRDKALRIIAKERLLLVESSSKEEEQHVHSE